MYIQMLAQPPCEVRYADFNYCVEPVATEGQDTSYIAARLLGPNGKLWEPRHEHALTRILPQKDAAQRAWSVGFETVSDFFVPRQIVDRLLEQGDAQEIAPIPKAFVPLEEKVQTSPMPHSLLQS